MGKMGDAAVMDREEAIVVGGITEADSSPQVDQIAAAMAKAQATIGAASKDRTNPHFGQKYATLASVVDASRAPLAGAGIAVLQPVAVETEGDATIVRVRTILMHSSGQWLGMTLAIQARDGGPQAVGSCITYGRRYGLSCMAGVAPDDDDDGNAGSGVGSVGAAKSAKANAAKSAASSGPTRMVNKVVAPCIYCTSDVQIGDGYSRNVDGKWETIHKSPCLDNRKAEQDEAARAQG